MNYETMKRNLNFYTKPVIAFLAILASIVLYFIIAPNRPTIEGLLSGEEPPKSIADSDPDLKCPAAGAESPAKCEISDLLKLSYDIALDPRVSVTELDAMSKICRTRKFNKYDNFGFDMLLLRAAALHNTTANEAEFKKILKSMSEKKSECYNNAFMKEVKGLLVGSKDEPTLSVAQSETIRCYAHRLNAIRKCLNACK